MKVSNAFEMRGTDIYFGGSGSLLGPAGGIAPQSAPQRSRPHSGAYGKQENRQSGCDGNMKNQPPKPLPVNPGYRNNSYQSLQERCQAEVPSYTATTPRAGNSAGSGRAVQHSRETESRARETASSNLAAHNREVAFHGRERASHARDATTHGYEASSYGRETATQGRESREIREYTHYSNAVSQREQREQAREAAAQREFAGSHRELLSRDREAAAELASRTPERTSLRHEERHMAAETRGPSRGAETRVGSGHGRVQSLDRSTRSITGGRQHGGGNTAAERLQAQRRSSATAAAARQDPGLDDEAAEYSDRFLAGYDRGRLLGKGACAVVWLATPTGQKGPVVALKQVAKGTTGKKRSDTEAARKEIFFGSYFFHPGGEPKLSPRQYPGISHIAKLLDYSETKRDIWMVMEFGGTCLTKMAYEIKGEFLRGERLYRVVHLPMLQAMKRDPEVLKGMLRQLLSALCVLADHHIVHSDIKPDNILIEEDEHHQLRCRFIDLGSAFTFDCPENLALATPEYMPPEALETCVARCGGSQRSSIISRSGVSGGLSSSSASRKPADPVVKLHRNAQPWSFDIWSLGSILLELCIGTPLWLSYKCRVADDQRANSAATGLFAVPGRDPDRIITKQCDALRQRGLANVLRNAQGIPLNNIDAGSGLELLSLMLSWDPFERISPQEALDHPWLQEPDY